MTVLIPGQHIVDTGICLFRLPSYRMHTRVGCFWRPETPVVKRRFTSITLMRGFISLGYPVTEFIRAVAVLGDLVHQF
jgi:hypothetical protein